jgi:thiol-disulfide isomerase/thioredoxin
MKILKVAIICTLCLNGLIYGQESKKDLTIIDNYNKITTIPELLSSIKGKPVFIDLWAPWCEPCKEEFKFSNTLYQQLQKRGIQMLYVSLNANVTDTAWKSDILKFQLRGMHVLANKQLQDALTTLIWGGVDAYSIPHYLLFDSNGNLLLKDTLPPSSESKLLNQIESKLQ